MSTIKGVSFDARLEFELTLIAYEGRDAWVEGVLGDLHGCFERDEIPDSGADCDYCLYRNVAKKVEE